MEAELITKKLSELPTEMWYTVQGYKSLTTKYGQTHLLIIEEGTGHFQMFATKYISDYITEKKPYEKFMIKVMKNKRTGNNYVEIENNGGEYSGFFMLL